MASSLGRKPCGFAGMGVSHDDYELMQRINWVPYVLDLRLGKASHFDFLDKEFHGFYAVVCFGRGSLDSSFFFPNELTGYLFRGGAGLTSTIFSYGSVEAHALSLSEREVRRSVS